MDDLPTLPCPNCNTDILENGFFSPRMGAHKCETSRRDCGRPALCSACKKLLPWSLHQILALRNHPLEVVARLVMDMRSARNRNPICGEA